MAREMTPGNSPDQFSRIQRAKRTRGETRWIPNRLVKKVENPNLNHYSWLVKVENPNLKPLLIPMFFVVSHVFPILAG